MNIFPTSTAADYLAQLCPNSTFQSNLNRLLSTLSSNANRSIGFDNAIVQTTNNAVYGLFLCRGDIVVTDACETCVATAIAEALTTLLLRKTGGDLVRRLHATLLQRVILLHCRRVDPLVHYERDGYRGCQRCRQVRYTKKKKKKKKNISDLIELYSLKQCTQDLFYAQNATTPEPALVAHPPPPKVVAIVVPISVYVLLIVVGYCCITRRARKKYNQAAADEPSGENDITTVESLQFDFAAIQAATSNFSDDHKLGEGGFGQVYKGILSNGQEVTVKRLSRNSGQGTEEFKNEMVLVAKLQHRNLVRLLRFCLEGQEKILIYEFVLNKSLDYFLFGLQLDWSRRYKIISGIAQGIVYLHEASQLRIIHHDLKVSNILLDGEMHQKISDFGTARIFGYATHEHFSVKSDLYSFSVLVLEIISGKKNSNFFQSDVVEDLMSHLWRDRAPLELLDPCPRDSYSRTEVIRCIHIGLLFLMLSSYSLTLPSPQQPTFFLQSRAMGNMSEPTLDSTQSISKSSPSVYEGSITKVYPK
ncbi:cysteine-rich receptor-like protein kinase 10 [Pyrus ussuriensis x Pyrus communis]|uniref:non-specific serine/threonine protein kinase n=1 Tax=Pyrus ussuriensis x Pyrus communis TaxID=2448454 RepID=A0A5N5GP14_9ROSA|nr:cysteine-rich receptor-like protein kinase 10 [Pyrus ussuriensis x Pyrus communis]